MNAAPSGLIRIVFDIIDAFTYAADDDPAGEIALAVIFGLVDVVVIWGLFWLAVYG